MNTKNLKLLFVFIIFVLYLKNYQQIESFGLMKRRMFGFANLTSNSNPNFTLKNEDRLQIEEILKLIINNINKRTESKYILGSLDNITINKEEEGKSYTIDFFIHELNNFFTRRIIINLVVLNNHTDNKQNVKINHINISNGFKYPNNDFDTEKNADDLILKKSNYENNYILTGYSDSVIPYKKLSLKELSAFDQYENPESAKKHLDMDFHKWILPDNISSTKESVFPCRNQTDNWDNNGINYLEDPKCDCYGIKNTNSIYPVQPYFNKTINSSITTNNKYSWLFGASREDIDHPHARGL
jgi:hypothetical protein